MSGHLNPGGQQFRDDDGAADPGVTQALAAYLEGTGSEQAALTALSAARLLVPVVAVGSASPGGDKNSEMVLPTLIGQDGRPAVLAFTCLDALTRWRRTARPVPAEADRVWRAAVADHCAVVIDVAGPVPLAVEGARLDALAAGRPVPPPHEDPDVRAEVAAAVAADPAIAGFSLAAGSANSGADSRADSGAHSGADSAADGSADGTDLAIELSLATRDWEPVVERAANSIAGRLCGRLRRGIEFTVTTAGK